MPHVGGQRTSPSTMVGGGKLHLESNSTPARDIQRAQTNLVHTRTQRVWDWTVFKCLPRRYGSAVACHRDGGSGCSRPGCGISPLGLINPTIELPELTQGWGNRPLEGTNRTLYAPRPRRKEQWPHKRLTQICPGVSRCLVEMWVGSGQLQG